MAWTIVKTWNSGDVLPALDLDTYLRDNLVMLHDRGPDLASAATITPTTGFHKVTGTVTIATIAGPTDAAILLLWFGSALTVQHGTGNISMSDGFDRAVPADTMMAFRSDGTTWKEYVPGRSGMSAFSDTVLVAQAGGIDIQNIPASARHLRLLYTARSIHAAGGTDALLVRLNNDSGANYDRVSGGVSDATAVKTGSFGDTSMKFANAIPTSFAGAGRFGSGEVLFPNYATASAHKLALARYSAWADQPAADAPQAMFASGLWQSTSAVNRLAAFVDSAPTPNVIPGTRFTLYLL